MKVLKFSILFSIGLISISAFSEPFARNELFFTKTIKQTTKTKHFSAGIEFQIAPVKAIVKSQMDKIINSACEKSSNKELCISQTNLVLENAKYVNENYIKNKEYEKLKQEILKIEGLSAEEKAEIEKIDFSSQEISSAINLLSDSILDKEDAITFSLIPYGEINLEFLTLRCEIPLAGFSFGGDMDFAIGNITVDGKFGHYFSLAIGDLGLSYGLGVYIPTGSEKANALGLSNILIAPKFYKEFLTLSPYVSAGLDLNIVLIQVSAEIVNMIRVRGEDVRGTPIYLKYGGGISVVPLSLFFFVIELDGVKNIQNAENFNGIFLTPGLFFKFFAIFDFGIAAQIPLATEESEKYATFGGLPFGSPSKINVVVNASVGF